MTTFGLLVMVVVAALVFDFINGFHDTANAIATVVSTGVMRTRTAVLMAAALNVVGAFLGTAVASTIGKDLVDPAQVSQQLVLAAIVWNLFTWWFGIPSSSSHALVGGIIGAGMTALGAAAIKPPGVEKVVTALVLSPLLGFGFSFVLMVAMYWIVRRARPTKINKLFRRLQVISAGFMAVSHGSNDAQKTMGVITMALVSYQGTYDAVAKFPVPTWVVISCALAMGLGTASGSWRWRDHAPICRVLGRHPPDRHRLGAHHPRLHGAGVRVLPGVRVHRPAAPVGPRDYLRLRRTMRPNRVRFMLNQALGR